MCILTFVHMEGGVAGTSYSAKHCGLKRSCSNAVEKAGVSTRMLAPNLWRGREIEGLTPPYDPVVHSQTYYSKAVQFIHCLVTRL